MICLNELKFYTNGMLLGIAASTTCCVIGISILLEKNKEKRAAITLDGVDTENGIELDSVAQPGRAKF